MLPRLPPLSGRNSTNFYIITLVASFDLLSMTIEVKDIWFEGWIVVKVKNKSALTQSRSKQPILSQNKIKQI